MRYLLGSIADWDALYSEAYKTLRPGGWLEHYEAAPYLESDDGTVGEMSAMSQWGPIFIEGSKKTGRSFTLVPDGVQKTGMEKAGFVDCQTWNFKVGCLAGPEGGTVWEGRPAEQRLMLRTVPDRWLAAGSEAQGDRAVRQNGARIRY